MKKLRKIYFFLYRRKKLVKTNYSHRILPYTFANWIDQIERAVQDVSRKDRFLDIGAGSGHLSALLCRTYFKEGMAIEAAPNKQVWAEMLAENSNLSLTSNLIKTTLKDMVGKVKFKFNFILLIEVFEHLPPQEVPAFLEELNALLEDDGRCLLSTPNYAVLGPAESSPIWHERVPYGHYKHYSSRELMALLEEHGFEIIWHCFMKHRLQNLYEKIYYPLSTWDFRLMNTSVL